MFRLIRVCDPFANESTHLRALYYTRMSRLIHVRRIILAYASESTQSSIMQQVLTESSQFKPFPALTPQYQCSEATGSDGEGQEARISGKVI